MWVTLVLVVFTCTALAYYVVRSRKTSGEPVDYGDVLKPVMEEISRRLDRQDRKILDYQVKVDILETQLERRGRATSEGASISNRADGVQQTVYAQPESRRTVASQTSQTRVSSGALDRTAEQVLGFLAAGPRSPRQIQESIGRSREHTARLMKRLFEQGYVDRDELKRPFMYQLKRREPA